MEPVNLEATAPVNLAATAPNNGVSAASRKFLRRFGLVIDLELSIKLKDSPQDAVEECIRDKLLSDKDDNYDVDDDKFEAFLEEVPALMIKQVYKYLDDHDNRGILDMLEEEDVQPEDMEDDVQAMFVKEFRFGEWGYGKILAYKAE
jgi:hypothetical protein